MQVMIEYYHADTANTLHTYVCIEALDSFIRVLLSSGYIIIEIK